MTLQKLFDTVALHLLRQNALAVDPKTLACRYRGPNGTKCAIGVLIPDRLYKLYGPTIEGKRVKELPRDLFFECEILYDAATLDLLEALQDVHDDVDTLPGSWRAELVATAIRFGLSPKAVEDFPAC